MTFSTFYFTDLTSISKADPAVCTLVDHGLHIGDRIRLETDGTLPTGLAVKTDYWVVYNGLTTSTFQLAISDGGTPIETTVASTDTHSFMKMNRAGLIPRVEGKRNSLATGII